MVPGSFKCHRVAVWRLLLDITTPLPGMNISLLPPGAPKSYCSPRREWLVIREPFRSKRCRVLSGFSHLRQARCGTQGSAFLWELVRLSETMGRTVRVGNRGNPSRRSSKGTFTFPSPDTAL